MLEKMFSTRKLFYIIAAVIILLLVNAVYLQITRAGKTQVNILVFPKNSQIIINGKSSSKNVYLKPGKYTFIAKAEGYKDDKVTITIEDEPEDIGLLPSPSSDEVKNLLNNKPQLQEEREAIGALKASKKGMDTRKQTPLIDKLPRTDIYGPYTIDYGHSPNRENGIFIEIRNTSPEGRVNALKWIREQGQDPTNLEIRYINYVNPLRGQGTW